MLQFIYSLQSPVLHCNFTHMSREGVWVLGYSHTHYLSYHMPISYLILYIHRLISLKYTQMHAFNYYYNEVFYLYILLFVIYHYIYLDR